MEAVLEVSLCVSSQCRYEAVLGLAPDDVEVLTNEGDVSIKRAELVVRGRHALPQAYTSRK